MKVKQLSKEKAKIEPKFEQAKTLQNNIQEINELYELSLEENDDTIISEIESYADDINHNIELIEKSKMFCSDSDHLNCYVDIQSGSGGTEAQDWAQMLLRMYQMWWQKKDSKLK